uniref:Sigma-70 family RNA polymerase sigma factor n=1 Tax=Dictyoglomus thermophilum TaxID=14 RepID=A0A7C3RXH2_DICTH
MNEDFGELKKLLSEIESFLKKYEENRTLELEKELPSLLIRTKNLQNSLEKILKHLELINDMLKNITQTLPKIQNTEETINNKIELKDYIIPLLEALYKLGGKASNTELIKHIEPTIKAILMEKNIPDINLIPWQKDIQECKLILIDKGFLNKDSPNHIWELSVKGYDYVKQYLNDIIYEILPKPTFTLENNENINDYIEEVSTKMYNLSKELNININDDSIKNFIKEVNKYKPPSPSEEIALFEKVKKGDKKARDTLILSYSFLVLDIAQKYKLKNLELWDLIQEGYIGLAKAVDSFNYKKGSKFSSYATFWIKTQIEKYIKKKNN